MNELLEKVNQLRFNYCHVVEVHDVYELEVIADQIYSDNIDDIETHKYLFCG